MPVYVYCPDHPQADQNGLVERRLAGESVSRASGTQIISDIMEPTRHMADGMLYDSKHRFREVTKAHGCIEVGDDRSLSEPKPRVFLKSKNDRGSRREAIRQAIYQLRNGPRPRYDTD